MIHHLLDVFLRQKIRRQTTEYLREIVSEPLRVSRERTRHALTSSRTAPGSDITIGTTGWGEPLTVPARELMTAHSLITGGTGAGKTRFALLLIKNLLDALPNDRDIGFGVLDPKGELFLGTQVLLGQRLNSLAEVDPSAAEELRRRVVILNFSSHDPVSPYNILARWPTAETSFFAASRTDLLLDLLPGGDGLSLGASAILRRIILLLMEFNLPITWLNDVLHDGDLRSRLLERSENEDVKAYFMRQFATAPKQTVAALSRRVDALFSSDGVRLSLSGTTAPDFRALQDEGKIVLISCFGENISRSVRQLLQALVLSDIAQAIFARKKKGVCFPFFCDEAQALFSTQNLRDHMQDVLTMSRSFGTFLCCLTQNIGTAVHDTRLLNSLFTNIRWSFSMRGEPTDCAFLKSALPVTGRRRQPRTDPFQEPGLYSLTDERTIALNEIAALPDRAGYFWFRPRSSEAIKMDTADLALPSGVDIDQAMKSLGTDSTIGMRIPRTEYQRQVDERNQAWRQAPRRPVLNQTLADSYQRKRGKRS